MRQVQLIGRMKNENIDGQNLESVLFCAITFNGNFPNEIELKWSDQNILMCYGTVCRLLGSYYGFEEEVMES
jgi:hypothetical protein